MAARPRTYGVRALRLDCWNADGVRDRKLELDYFLSQHGVLTETHLSPGDVSRPASFVCYRTERPTEGGGTAILILRCIDHYALPVPGLMQLEATAIHIMLASGPVKILAVYLSPSPPLIRSDLSASLAECFLPYWQNSRLNTRARLLRDYGNEHCCLIYGPDTPTAIPYNFSATTDVLDIVLTKGPDTPMYLTMCSTLRSDHLPVLIDSICRSSFLNVPEHPDVRRTDWVKFQACLVDRPPSTLKLPNEVEIDRRVEELSGGIG